MSIEPIPTITDPEALPEPVDPDETPELTDEEKRQLFRELLHLPTDWDIDAALEDPRWLVKDWLPAGCVVMLAGAGGGGKSTLARQLAFAVAAGDPAGQQQSLTDDDSGRQSSDLNTWVHHEAPAESLRVHPDFTSSPVMYVSWEDSKDWFTRTAMAVSHVVGTGHDFRSAVGGRISYVQAGERGALWGPKGDFYTHGFTSFGAALLGEATGLACRLLVVDTLAAAYDSDENNRHKVRDFLSRLGNWAKAHDCTVLVISHPSKSGLANGGGTSGSTDWEYGVRAVLETQWRNDPDDKGDKDRRARWLYVRKSNYGPTGFGRWLTMERRAVVRERDQQLRDLLYFASVDAFPVEAEDRL